MSQTKISILFGKVFKSFNKSHEETIQVQQAIFLLLQIAACIDYSLFFSPERIDKMNKDVTIDASKCLSSIQRTLVSTYMSTALWWCTLYFINQFQGDKKALYNSFFFSFECQFVAWAILFEIQISWDILSIGLVSKCSGFL